MYISNNWMPFLFVVLFLASCKNDPNTEESMAQKSNKEPYTEPYRPQFHFSPEKMWMNDPNGMVYNKGVYHLFYQYHPNSMIWGPMHWGHATSKDLLNWQHKPIALYPDEHGLIFSGSAVLDKQNSSGFGTDDNPPLVAIFTYHDAKIKAAGGTGFETQGIAYSLDNGDSWTKYNGNPVIADENSIDFRDPKVFWYEPDQKWIMSLVAGNHAQFYGSKNLKDWDLLSEFGKDKGAHGGVWECPDLIPFKIEDTNKEKWVLFISINPGAPNGGSGTQYFIGDFDGKTFTTDQTEDRWIDWGTDNYAGVTFSNALEDETIFLGWMSNWQYANETPTSTWRGAMTLPRKLTLEPVGKGYALFNYPIEKVDDLISGASPKRLNIAIGDEQSISTDSLMQSEIRFATSSKDFQLKFGNEADEELVLTMKTDGNEFTLDRSRSGKTDFQEDFGTNIQQMPIPDLPDREYEVRIFMDRSSIEIFLNKGHYAMTAQVFPNEDYNVLKIVNTSEKVLEFTGFSIGAVKGVW